MDRRIWEVLLLEDNPGDALLIRESLNGQLDHLFNVTTVDTIGKLKSILKGLNPDIVLTDLSLPDSKGIATFDTLNNLFFDKPIIVLSGNNDEQMSNLAIQRGAQDYLVKGLFNEMILKRAIFYSIERKKLELSLKESEQKFKLLANNTPMFIKVCNINGTCNYYNKQFFDFIGRPISKAENIIWEDFIHEADIDSVKNIYEKAYKYKHNYTAEYKFKGKDKVITILEKSVINYTSTNEFNGFICTCLDITERKLAEKEIEQSKLRYKFLASNTVDLIWAMDLNMNLSFVSQAVYDFFGYTVEEYLILPVDKIMTLKSIEMIKDKIEKAIYIYNETKNLEATKTKKIEVEFIHKNGSIVYGEVNGQLSIQAGSDQLEIIGNTRDITQRKLAEEKTKLYQQKIEFLSKTAMSFMQADSNINIHELIGNNLSKFTGNAYIVINSINKKTTKTEAVVNFESNIETLNKLMGAKLVGKEFMLTEDALEQISKAHLVKLENGLGQLLLKNIPAPVVYAVETLFKLGDIYIIGLLHKEEPIASAIIILKKGEVLNDPDIIEIFIRQASIALQRKLSEDIVKKSEQELRESNLAKDKFFSIISHDLRSPFQGMLGYIDLINDDYDSLTKEEIKPIINNLKSLLHNQYELVEKLLAWANLQRGKIPFNPEKINVKLIVAKVVAMLKLNASKKNISLVNKIDIDYLIYADTEMINSIFINVITNAIKFTKNNGSVIVDYKNRGSHTEFIISDTGVGMSEKEVEQLFKIDEQRSKLGTAHERGTGLGLILCKEFVNKHRGNVWIVSELGKGTEFHFLIPKEGY